MSLSPPIDSLGPPCYLKCENRHPLSRTITSQVEESVMQEDIDIPKLLALRKLTKKISSYIEQELTSYLGALAPSFHPRYLLGEHIQGVKQTVNGSSETLKELLSVYQSIRKSKRFLNQLADMKPPLALFGKSLEITTVEYDYEATNETETKVIRMRSPLRWTLAYREQGLKTLRQLLAAPVRSGDTSLDVCVMHHLIMHFIASSENGATKVLEALRFKVNSEPSAQLGGLPLVYIASPVSTICPPDDLIIQSTELSGTSFFEEVVNIDDIDQLRDPLKEQLFKLVG